MVSNTSISVQEVPLLSCSHLCVYACVRVCVSVCEWLDVWCMVVRGGLRGGGACGKMCYARPCSNQELEMPDEPDLRGMVLGMRSRVSVVAFESMPLRLGGECDCVQ